MQKAWDNLNFKGNAISNKWLKIYSYFSEKAYFAYWCSCIGKGLCATCKAGLFKNNC